MKTLKQWVIEQLEYNIAEMHKSFKEDDERMHSVYHGEVMAYQRVFEEIIKIETDEKKEAE